jgi:hypothetical protein
MGKLLSGAAVIIVGILAEPLLHGFDFAELLPD